MALGRKKEGDVVEKLIEIRLNKMNLNSVRKLLFVSESHGTMTVTY